MMQNREFDLDVTFEETAPDVSHLSSTELKARIAKLPEALRPVATGILIEKRTFALFSCESRCCRRSSPWGRDRA
jgi:hypothetical protein